MKDKIWHHGQYLENGKCNVRVSSKSEIVELDTPDESTEIKTIEQAIAYILKYPHNLQRVCGKYYKCSHHNKVHKFTFYSCVSFSWPFMKGLDTKEEVILFAKELQESYKKK